MQGRVVVVTGASSGIGLATAHGLASLGARVVLVSRDRSRGEAARSAIASRVAAADLELLVADLASQAEVRRLAAEISARYACIHVLVNNAAAVYSRRALSVDGIEMQLAVNHLAPYLLTRLLVGHLRKGGHARIVNVTSRAHARGRIDFDDLGGSHQYSGPRAYNQSKLANVLFTYELARRLSGTPVTANCLHPGLVRTRIGNKHTLWHHSLLHTVSCVLGRSAARGARTAIHLASSPDVEGVSGRYFGSGRAVESSATSRDAALALRLWRVSADLTGLPADGAGVGEMG